MTLFNRVGAIALLALLPVVARAQDGEGRNPLSILGNAKVTLAYDRYLIVTGEGEVVAEPDEALFAIGIRTEHTDIDSVLTQNDEKLRKLIALASELGIATADIRKDPLAVVPDEVVTSDVALGFSKGAFGSDGKDMKQYRAHRSVTVKLRRLNDFTTFLARIYKLDLKLESTPFLHASNESKLREQVRLAAIRDAEEKATGMVTTLGRKGGITVQSLDSWDEWSSGDPGGSQSPYRGDSEMPAAYRSGDPRVQAGTIVYRATVRVLYEMK
jgi:uncharacterized protein YggE